MDGGMMDWQARLIERRETFSECPDGVLTKPTKPGSVSFVSSPDARFQNIAADPATIRTRLIEVATAACADPELVHRLTTADLAECDGLPDAVLLAYVRALADADLRERGKRPADETAAALCRSCGPVWLAPEVASVAPMTAGWPRVLGCPWCHVANRRAIPRPPVACGNCRHFARDAINPGAGMGICGAGKGMHYPMARHTCGNHSIKELP
jgi:hypothetical protein